MSIKSDIAQEVTDRFTDLATRLRMMMQLHRVLLMEMIETQAELFPSGLESDEKTLLAAAYLFCHSEDVFHGDFKDFLDTYLYYLEVHDVSLQAVTKDLESFVTPWFRRFCNSLFYVHFRLTKLFDYIIFGESAGFDVGIIKVRAFRDFLEPMQDHLTKNLGLDWLYSIALVMNRIYVILAPHLPDSITKNEIMEPFMTVRSVDAKLRQLLSDLPKDELLFDVWWFFGFRHLYPYMTAALQDEIDKIIKTREIDREIAQRIYEHAEEQEKMKYTDDRYFSSISMKLMEVFELNNDFDHKKRQNVLRNFETLLRRYLVDATGYAHASEKELLQTSREIIWHFILEYPHLTAAFALPEHLTALQKEDDATSWLLEHKDMLQPLLDAFIRRCTGSKVDSRAISEAFVQLIAESARLKNRFLFV